MRKNSDYHNLLYAVSLTMLLLCAISASGATITLGNTALGTGESIPSDYSKTVLWTYVDTLAQPVILDSAYIGVHTFITGTNDDQFSVAVYTYHDSLAACTLITFHTWGAQPTAQINWVKSAVSGDTLKQGKAYIIAFAVKNNNAVGNLRIRYDNIGTGWGMTKYLGSQSDLVWPLTLENFSDHADRGYSVYLICHELIPTHTNHLRRRKCASIKF